jgi:hypothetical protein
MKNLHLLLLLIICSLFSCTKEEIIYENEHINVIINDNDAPPYSGITSIQIEGYVNRLFIDLLGREPSVTERTQTKDYLKSNDLTTEARAFVLNQLMTSNEYYQRFFTVHSGKLLDGITEQDITNGIATFNILYNNAVTAGNAPLAQYYQKGQVKLTSLQQAISDYSINLISIDQFFARLIDNPFFDDINMGSENFAIGSFEGLFNRLPTETELTASIEMVDGFSAQLLLKDGNGKDDFIKIVTTVPEFYQGLTIDIYNQLLARNPDSPEMSEGTIILSSTSDYKAVQELVLISDEYAGF